MILNRIREVSLQNKIDKELKNSNVGSNGKVESALILFDENVDVEIFELIGRELEFDKQKVKAIIFCDKLNNEVQNFQTKISKKQFSWFGKVRDEKVRDLINSKFDLLINLTKGNLYLDYLTVLSNSQFKVGLSNSDIRLYDFMISTDLEEKTVFSNELKKYLKILNKI
jgi:hypothetical protein